MKVQAVERARANVAEVFPMPIIRKRIRVEGIVQGVGFRPFVFSLAMAHNLLGTVSNDNAGVLIEVEGDEDEVARFVASLERKPPPLAVIERISSETLQPTGTNHSFAIATSEHGAGGFTLVAPDVATCPDCLRELRDPANRRFEYAFTNCTNCGPRFTIVRDLPYDRPNTTMADFGLCNPCTTEYMSPVDRRFHAQPVACAACGPQLKLLDGNGTAVAGDPIREAARMLSLGHVIAVKGLGGFHLAVDARHPRAANVLRQRKYRDEKPFALMVTDLEAARTLADISPLEEEMLTSLRRPIVLVKRRANAGVSEAVAPKNRLLGIMLPYTPLHHLLLRAFAEIPPHDVLPAAIPPHAPQTAANPQSFPHNAVVLTSANLSDEPIVYRDEDAQKRLSSLADACLTHDRPIHVRTDDSIVRVYANAPIILRRARGYVPQPVTLPFTLQSSVLSVGAELKSTICVGRDRHAFASQHLGDLETEEAFRSFTDAIDHFARLFRVRPTLIAHDMHPDYLSTRWALEQGIPTMGVQHHHAHVAACLVDNGESGPVIGVAFDGSGYGCDHTIWGGEFLVADLRDFSRVGHLQVVSLPGGTAAIREPWRMAAVYLEQAFGRTPPPLPVVQRNATTWDFVLRMAQLTFNSPLTSSAGRLFDAVASLLDVRDTVTYEGQAAVELEQMAEANTGATYAFTMRDFLDGFEVQTADLIAGIVRDLLRGTPRELVAGRFHGTVAEIVAAGCNLIRQHRGLNTVALCGGVFQNAFLTELTLGRLTALGFRVLFHRQIPPNDAAISVGQLAVAGATMAGSV